MGRYKFRKILPINVPKYNGGEIQVSWRESFQNYVNLQTRTWSIHFHHRHCGSYEYAPSRKKNHNEICITVKVSRRTQKVVFMLANDTSKFAFCSTDLGHIFGNNVGNEFGVPMIGKCPHERESAKDIVRIHSMMIYSILVEYNIVGETKIPLLRCFPFISKLKGGNIITTGQYMNYRTFSNLQFRPLLKNSFHSIHIVLRDTSGKKTLCICQYHSPWFDVQKGVQHSVLTHTVLHDGCFETSRNSIL